MSEIAAEYKRRFKQEAVFRVRYRVDASEIQLFRVPMTNPLKPLLLWAGELLKDGPTV